LDLAIVDPNSSTDYTTLAPTSISCLLNTNRLERETNLESGNKDPENFPPLNPAKLLENDNENPEEDFSHLSPEEQAVLSNIS
jgi:hypothetical protein